MPAHTNDPDVNSLFGTVGQVTTASGNGVHLTVTGNTPTVAGGAAVGTGAAPTLAAGSNDTRGQLTINVTGGTATGVLATVTFGGASATTFATAPQVLLTAANAAAGGLSTQVPFVTSTTATFVLNANGVTVPNGTYIYNYLVIG